MAAGEFFSRDIKLVSAQPESQIKEINFLHCGKVALQLCNYAIKLLTGPKIRKRPLTALKATTVPSFVHLRTAFAAHFLAIR